MTIKVHIYELCIIYDNKYEYFVNILIILYLSMIFDQKSQLLVFRISIVQIDIGLQANTFGKAI